MEHLQINQIIFLIFQCILVSGILLLFFKLRNQLGIGLFFGIIGAFQYLQYFLFSTIIYEVYPGFFVSPGTEVYFIASLFSILITFLREDTKEARKVLCVMIVTNVIIIFFNLLYNFNSENLLKLNNLTNYIIDERNYVVGIIVLLLDAFFLFFVYELISRKIKPLFVKMLLTMLIIVSFDTILYSAGTFIGTGNLAKALISGLISKNISVIVFTPIFYLYIRIFDKDISEKEFVKKSFNDIFNSLTYRQKYERIVYESAKQINSSDKRFQILAQISPVGIFQTETDGFTSYVNPKWCEISGLPYEEALGEGWLKVVHPDDRENIRIGWEKATKEKRMSVAEYRFINPSGEIKWVIGQAVPELDYDKNIISYVGTITDITELKHKEFELQAAKLKAEESDKMKTAFLQNISHEIRTPMNAIIGFSGLLVNEKVSGESKIEYADIINKSCNQLLSIVDDIVNIATIESGTAKINKQKVLLKQFLQYIINLFELKIKQKNLTFIKKIDDLTEEDFIFTDRVKLIQVISNIIQNAIKYTIEGSIELECKKNMGKIEFNIRDTGIGIEEQYLDKVFDRFFQADNSLTKKFGGTGLGLSITKAYIELFGGEIKVTSNHGKGTSIYFYLPFIVE